MKILFAEHRRVFKKHLTYLELDFDFIWITIIEEINYLGSWEKLLNLTLISLITMEVGINVEGVQKLQN